MNRILNKENLHRLNESKKKIADEKYIKKINKKISNLKISKSNNKKFPIIFIVGLPRSGTTITMQLLINTLKLKFINNLTARFWSNPEVGIKLSNILKLKYDEVTYMSNYGKTLKLNEPHEFFYFWEENLKLNENLLDHKKNVKNINWNSLKKKLNTITCSLDAPVIFKGIYPGFYAKKISALMDNVFFIFIKRKPIDIAMSLYKARIDYYGNEKIWWGTHPENYILLKKEDVYKQITGQILSLNKSYDEELNKIENKVIITYEDLCKNPDKIIKEIKKLVKKKIGYSLKQYKKVNFLGRVKDKFNNKDIMKKFHDEFSKNKE